MPNERYTSNAKGAAQLLSEGLEGAGLGLADAFQKKNERDSKKQIQDQADAADMSRMQEEVALKDAMAKEKEQRNMQQIEEMAKKYPRAAVRFGDSYVNPENLDEQRRISGEESKRSNIARAVTDSMNSAEGIAERRPILAAAERWLPLQYIDDDAKALYDARMSAKEGIQNLVTGAAATSGQEKTFGQMASMSPTSGKFSDPTKEFVKTLGTPRGGPASKKAVPQGIDQFINPKNSSSADDDDFSPSAQEFYKKQRAAKKGI